MKIQINTDKSINGDQRHNDYFTQLLSDELKHFSAHLSRVEVHLSDENGNKGGGNDIKCLIEARLEGRQPIAVTSQSDSVELAVTGAISKLKKSLGSIIDQIKNK